MKRLLLATTYIIALSMGTGWAQDDQNNQPKLPRAGQGPGKAAGERNNPEEPRGAKTGQRRDNPSADQRGDQTAKPDGAQPSTGDSGQRKTRKDFDQTNTGTNDDSGVDRPRRKAGQGRDDQKADTENSRSSAGSKDQPGRNAGEGSDARIGAGQDQGGLDRSSAKQERGPGEARIEGKLQIDRNRAGDARQRLVERFRGEPGRVDVDLHIGRDIPDRIRVRDVPPEIVDRYPEFRGYGFLINGNDVVIVDPGTRKVVEVVGGAGAEKQVATGRGEAPAHFGREQVEAIRRVILSDREMVASGGRGPVLRAPAAAEIRPLPKELTPALPGADSVGFFVDREGRIVVCDIDSREVLEVID